jgi:hypothetical protein
LKHYCGIFLVQIAKVLLEYDTPLTSSSRRDADDVAGKLAETAVSVGEPKWGALPRTGDAIFTVVEAMAPSFASIVRFPLTWIQRVPFNTTVQITISTAAYIRACAV